ncbi:MAG: hypothetical protein A3H43_01575 [Gammaproteobacteria bacterium RIFCSPLOWO2_02_FULL_42_9]|nr:MAG: hypothetical protein A3H43_01575 [Gammaproteobacteria bacterium RIFCSPLOWO2_02_FULL_42_9]
MLSDFKALASTVGELLRAKSYKLVTAESCTGGLLSAAITSVAGSSKWFERGFVTYSNESKQELLGVQTIEEFGAVSEQTACAMADGALKNSQADISLAITGVAGPDGGTKPIGTVWIACAVKGESAHATLNHFAGNRQSVREQAVSAALNLLFDVSQL